MKNILLVGFVMVSLSLLIAVYAIPAFAHGPGGDTGSADGGAWEAMYRTCQDGDWEAMLEAAGEVHEDYSGYMPCFGYYASNNGADYETTPSNGRGEMGYHMGGGMMGMMGWR